jgi:hypothetical protein
MGVRELFKYLSKKYTDCKTIFVQKSLLVTTDTLSFSLVIINFCAN